MRSPCPCRSAMRKTLATLTLALLAAAPVLTLANAAAANDDHGASHERHGNRNGRRVRDGAEITFAGVNRQGHERKGDHFSAQRLRDVIVVVHWKTLVGSHTQRLELIAPDGAVYQTFRTSIESVTGKATVETLVPVAGSWISDYHLFGTWRVNVYLDENAKTEGSDTFVLTH